MAAKTRSLLCGGTTEEARTSAQLYTARAELSAFLSQHSPLGRDFCAHPSAAPHHTQALQPASDRQAWQHASAEGCRWSARADGGGGADVSRAGPELRPIVPTRKRWQETRRPMSEAGSHQRPI